MSSSLPSPSDDYTAPTAMELTEAAWNAVMNSIGTRLRLLEAVRADFDALITLGTGQALASIAANIEPELVAARAALTQLQADAAAAEDIVAAIVSGSVPMTAVTGLSTALAGKATPADVTAAIDALKGSVPAAYDTLVEIATALAADQSAVASITAQLTAASILAKVLTVDGSGSGLDADVVHGTTPGTFGLALLAAATAAAARTALALGTAAMADIGTTANKLLQLDAAGKLPAVDGSQLTGIVTGGMTLLASMSTSGATSYTISGLNLAGYKALKIDITTQAKTGADTCIIFGGLTSASWSNGAWGSCSIDVDLLTGKAAVVFGPDGATAIAGVSASGITTATTSISFSVPGGAGYYPNAGTFKIYGVK